jgi:Rad3-related DNA helicase
MKTEFPYEKIRPEQQKFLDAVSGTDKKYIVAQMPTGSGKSGIAIYESMLANNSYIVVTNKALQDQYWRDFNGKFPIKMLKGMSNYDCTVNDGVKCDKGPCQGCDATSIGIKRYCRMNDMCPYYREAGAAFKSPIFLANTSIMRAVVGNREDKVKKRDVMIIDEAHLLEDFLVDVGTISFSADKMIKMFDAEKSLTKEDLHYLKHCEFESSSKPSAKMEKYIEICRGLAEKIYSEMTEYENEQSKKIVNESVQKAMESGTNSKKNKYKHKREIKDMMTKIEAYQNSDKTDSWVYNWDKRERRLDIVPVNVDWIFKKYFDGLADMIIFMSATILNLTNFASSLGIRPDQCCFVDVESTFDPKNAPIIVLGNCKTNYRDLQDEANMKNIVKSVKYILDQHKGQRGIIHTGNMKISKYIKENLRDPRLLVRLDEVRNEDILEEHMVSKDSVLVSSSMTEGIDLHDDLSQFQIIVKLPWDSLGNLRTKTLSDEVPLWYQNKMWQRLLQASGRSVRSHDDYAETFVLDAAFSFQHKKFSKYLPEYFEKRLINPNA